jgi:dTDP-4-dehydrorhamnose reductase
VLLDAMMRAGVRVIVFSSSCAIYGEPERMPISESTPLNPINPYGFTKLVCERMMDDFGRAHGFRSARLRYFNAAGAELVGALRKNYENDSALILHDDERVGEPPIQPQAHYRRTIASEISHFSVRLEAGNRKATWIPRYLPDSRFP